MRINLGFVLLVGLTLGIVLWGAPSAPLAVTPPTASPQTPSLAEQADSKKDTSVTSPATTLSKSGYSIAPLSREKVAELAKKLTPEQYRVTQNAGTEPAFCGTLLDNKKDGAYYCIVCGLPLFSSSNKFDSGSGWPSFFAPFDPPHVVNKVDNSHGMERVEINCARCSAHLGHVFEDGPKPTGLRYCLNGASLVFHAKGEELPVESRPAAAAVTLEAAYFAGGCFWGAEHYFQLAPGVVSAESGYMQGSSASPTYKEVCEQDSVPKAARGADFKTHAEVVKVVFDPKRISYARLLEGFFEMHDPTTLNSQGPDYGTQYRSGLYFATPAQGEIAKKFVAQLAAKNLFEGKRIVTEIEAAKTFYVAEDYHQDYLVKHPERGCHIGQPWWVTQKDAAKKTPVNEGVSSK